MAFTSSLLTIQREIERGERRQRQRAASHLRKEIKSKAMQIKDTGGLAKATYVKNMKTRSYVGIHAKDAKSPGQQASLLEFGTSKMRARPIVYPTFDEQADRVAQIMAEPWVK